MLYEYKCINCSHNFEIFSSISDRDKPIFKNCPKCDERTIIRVPSISHFKINGYNEKNGYSKSK